MSAQPRAHQSLGEFTGEYESSARAPSDGKLKSVGAQFVSSCDPEGAILLEVAEYLERDTDHLPKNKPELNGVAWRHHEAATALT